MSDHLHGASRRPFAASRPFELRAHFWDVPPFDLEARAHWHLELLGCFEPGDAVAPWVPPPEHLDDWPDDEDYEGEYLGHVICWKCGGEGSIVECVDDLCHGQDWCMHGDNRMCSNCGGEGHC